MRRRDLAGPPEIRALQIFANETRLSDREIAKKCKPPSSGDQVGKWINGTIPNPTRSNLRRLLAAMGKTEEDYARLVGVLEREDGGGQEEGGDRVRHAVRDRLATLMEDLDRLREKQRREEHRSLSMSLSDPALNEARDAATRARLAADDVLREAQEIALDLRRAYRANRAGLAAPPGPRSKNG